jgi:hypothetical protein
MLLDAAEPPVAELLEVDRDYRREARKGTLRQIAPHRFNPLHEAWLPILHTVRRGRKYTALFSNTEQAHRRGKTHDWVVLYFDDGRGERQCTVVTEYRGPLRRRRVVRGRELECAEHYGVPIEPAGEVLWFEPVHPAEPGAVPTRTGAPRSGRRARRAKPGQDTPPPSLQPA